MICQTCHVQTLSKDERERFFAEPATQPIFFCPEHEAAFQERNKVLFDSMSKVFTMRVDHPREQITVKFVKEIK